VYGGADLAHLSVLADVPAASMSWTDSGRGEGVTVHYVVSAINSIGESPMSLEAFATTFARPSVVQNFVAAPAPLVGVPGRTMLSWKAPATNGGTPVQNYRVYRSNQMQAQALVATLPAAARNFVDSTLLPLLPYQYQVVAVNMVGEGPRAGACTHASPWVDALAALFPCV
jgi:hypothetical protein